MKARAFKMYSIFKHRIFNTKLSFMIKVKATLQFLLTLMWLFSKKHFSICLSLVKVTRMWAWWFAKLRHQRATRQPNSKDLQNNHSSKSAGWGLRKDEVCYLHSSGGFLSHCDELITKYSHLQDFLLFLSFKITSFATLFRSIHSKRTARADTKGS